MGKRGETIDGNRNPIPLNRMILSVDGSTGKADMQLPSCMELRHKLWLAFERLPIPIVFFQRLLLSANAGAQQQGIGGTEYGGGDIGGVHQRRRQDLQLNPQVVRMAYIA